MPNGNRNWFKNEPRSLSSTGQGLKMCNGFGHSDRANY